MGVLFFISVYSNGCSVPLCENGYFIAVCDNGHIRKPDRQQFEMPTCRPATGDHTRGSKSKQRQQNLPDSNTRVASLRPFPSPPATMFTETVGLLGTGAQDGHLRAQELRESGGGRPELLSLLNLRILWT